MERTRDGAVGRALGEEYYEVSADHLGHPATVRPALPTGPRHECAEKGGIAVRAVEHTIHAVGIHDPSPVEGLCAIVRFIRFRGGRCHPPSP